MRHAYDNVRLRQRRQRIEDFSAPFGKGRASNQAERHVASSPEGSGLKLLFVERAAVQLVKRRQHCGRIRRASAQAGAHGYTLRDAYMRSARYAQLLVICPGSFYCHIFVPGGDVTPVGLREEIAFAGRLYIHVVGQGAALHHHAQLVETVLPGPQYVEGEVQLGARRMCCALHLEKSRGISSVPELRNGPYSPLASL